MSDDHSLAASTLRLNSSPSYTEGDGISIIRTKERTSKFYFPMPGHKHGSSSVDKDRATLNSSPGTSRSNTLSKAQRVLGMDGLNVDGGEISPYWECGMTFSLTESEHSPTSEISRSEDRKRSTECELDSAVLPQTCYTPGEASLKAPERRHDEVEEMDKASVTTPIRQERSESTLKSYYDRETSPLAISQQTSASSARDLALRKGLPPVMQKPRLLELEPLDVFTEPMSGDGKAVKSFGKSPKKKPARLDFSMLFSKTRRSTTENQPRTPGTILKMGMTTLRAQSADSEWKKLKNMRSKESLKSATSLRLSQRSRPRLDRTYSQASSVDTIYSLYEKYESSHLDRTSVSQIPEPKMIARQEKSVRPSYSRSNSNSQRRFAEPTLRLQSLPEESLPVGELVASSGASVFSWNNMQSSLENPEKISTTQNVSSRHIKTSKHTGAGLFSVTNLRHSSVLSLSSDSEEEEQPGPPVPPKERLPQGLPPKFHQQIEAVLSTRSSTAAKHIRQKSSKTVSSKSTRLAAPESPPRSRYPVVEQVCHSRCAHATPPRRERKMSKNSSQYSLPRLVPDIPNEEGGNSRFIAVTEQEEALLAALRQKRARMREKIIEEHETRHHRSRPSNASVPSRTRLPEPVTPPPRKTPRKKTPNSSQQRETILMVLKTPISEVHPVIQPPEPSPDLSDFLTFGSDDEDSAPRNSWVATKRERAKADPFDRRHDRCAPVTPPHGARLSAFGVSGQELPLRRSPSPPTRYIEEDEELLSPRSECVIEEGETFVIWRM